MENTNIDFQVIPTLDPRYITVADYSTWGQLEGKPTIIEVLVAGESTPRVLYFNQKQLNVLNSLNLGINCVGESGETELLDLPDGIYEITVKGSPSSFYKTRKYLRTTLLELELDKVFIEANLVCKKINEDLIDKVMTIKFLLEAAKSNLRYDNTCQVSDLLDEINKLMENIKGCKTCK